MSQSPPAFSDVAPVQLEHKARMRDPRRGHGRRLPRRPRPDRRRARRCRGSSRDLRRQRALHVGDHRVPADGDDQRSDLRQAVRPVRTPADLPVRHRRSFMLGSLLCGPVPARCGSSSCPAASRASARAPCSRSRWRSSATCSRRPSAAGTRACSARCSACRSLIGPAHRRAHHRHHRLALGVLRQPADRRVRPASSSGGTCPPTTWAGERPRIDYLGAALFTAALVPILVGPDQQAVGRVDRRERSAA